MADFNRKYGVAFDDETADEIEKFLSEGDSRSARIRRLVQLGLEAERQMLNNDYYPPSADQREEIVREAVACHMEELTA